MALYKYSVDGSTLSISDRSKLIYLLEELSDIGVIFVDTEKGLYQIFVQETTDISSIPFPPGTILNRIYP